MSFAVVGVIVGALVICFRVVYMVNDDVAMASFANGSYTGRPEAHLVFMGAIPGIALSLAYRVLGDVPWYGLGLLAGITGCISLLAALCWSRRRELGTAAMVLIGVETLAFLPTLVLQPTFTVVASLFAACGVFALVFALTGARTRRLLVVVSAVCFVLSASIRWDAMLGMVLILGPFVATIAVRAWGIGWRKLVPLVVVLGALVGVVHLGDVTWNQRGSWAAFTEFNAVRGDLSGTARLTRAVSDPTEPAISAALVDNHWVADDLRLFDGWFFDDPNVYSTEHLDRLLRATTTDRFALSFGDAVSEVFDGRLDLMALVLLAAIDGFRRLRRRARLLVPLQLVWSAGVFVVVAANARFPDRVALPGLFVVVLALTVGYHLLLPSTPGVEPASPAPARRQWRQLSIDDIVLVVAVAAMVVGPIWWTRGPLAVSHRNATAERNLSTELTKLDSVDRSGRFVFIGATLDAAGVDPLGSFDLHRSARLVGIGWPTFSPLYEERKVLMDLDGNMLSELIDRDGVYLISPRAFVPWLQRAYARRLGQYASFDEMIELENDVWVYRIVTSTREQVEEDADVYSPQLEVRGCSEWERSTEARFVWCTSSGKFTFESQSERGEGVLSATVVAPGGDGRVTFTSGDETVTYDIGTTAIRVRLPIGEGLFPTISFTAKVPALIVPTDPRDLRFVVSNPAMEYAPGP